MRSAIAAVAMLACACTAAVAPSPSPSPTRAPTSAPPASPTMPVRVEVTLRRAAFPASPEGSAVTDVTAHGSGFVAVGFDGHDRAMAWRSADGETWTQVADSAAFAGGVMSGVVSQGGRLIAVGRDTSDIERTEGAAWTSTDGTTWQRIEGGGAPRGGQLVDVMSNGSGFLAVGSTGIPEDAAAVWISSDGTAWERVPHQESLARAFLWVVRAVPGGLLAGGWRRAPAPRAALWRSTDGRTWTLLPDMPGAPGYQVRSISVADGIVVAAGDLVEGGRANAWYTVDGTAWVRVEERATLEMAAMTTLLPLDPGLVAVGGRDDDAAVWSSPDGRAWTPVIDDATYADAYLTSVARSGDRLVAVGVTQRRIEGTGSYVQHAAAWSGTAKGSRGR